MVRALCSPRVPAALCVLLGLVSLPPAIFDVLKIGGIVASQLSGHATGTDFLNLYAGAYLLDAAPEQTYRFDSQMTLQRSLTGTDTLLVPFYLPPYAALLVSWLGLMAYAVAYLVWLVLGVACIVVAAHWLAPRWTRWNALLWLGLSLLFLPVVLGLAQGQTAAVMLLCVAAFARGMLDREHGTAAGLILGSVGLALKPQFAPLFVLALLLARRWTALVGAGVIVGLLTLAALARLGPEGTAAYALASRSKLGETLTADPTFLLGPTLLHASHWFLGVNALAHGVAAVLALGVVAAFLYIWRRGPADGDARLLQLAVVPIGAIIAAPYALVYELTLWLVSFWLLWCYTATRQTARIGLLWLATGAWLTGDMGVGLVLTGGSDYAALIGLAAVAWIAWMYHAHVRCSGTLGVQLKTSSPRGSE